MAIVKTTNRDEGDGGGSGEGRKAQTETSLDRTKSVVNQGGRSPVRRQRTPGMVSRPSAQASNPGSARGFLDDTIAELRKVVWPSKEKRNSGTIVTIGLLIFFGLYILGLDTLAQQLFAAAGVLPPPPIH